jgi:hypothetical protein
MALFFLLFYTPVVVFAFRISVVAGVVAIAMLLFLGAIGSDTWGGSGRYPRR